MFHGHNGLRGAAAGLAATIPMTIVMEALRAVLPAEQIRRTPPREIVDRTIDKAIETTGEGAELDRGDRVALTMGAHFAFGAAAGAIYGAATGLRRSSLLIGMAYGLGVWAVAYGVGLPSLGLHPAATEDTKDRNEVLIASHLVWGATLALMARPTNSGIAGAKIVHSRDLEQDAGNRSPITTRFESTS
jgi:putative membrane protein